MTVLTSCVTYSNAETKYKTNFYIEDNTSKVGLVDYN